MRGEHLTAAETAAYASRQLSPSDALELSDHLIECAECRALVRQSERVHATAAERPSVPYEELVAVLDDELDPLSRREVMEKIDQSPRARAELDDLRQFKSEVAASQPSNARRQSVAIWALPLAALLVTGVAFLWWNVAGPAREGAVVLRDNEARLQVLPNGDVVGLPDLPAELRSSLKSGLTQNRIVISPAVPALAGRAGNLAGAAENATPLRLLSPVGVAVEAKTPQLEWTPDPQASGYRVTLARSDTDEVVRTAEVPANATRWSPSKPLDDGGNYTWQVQALSGDSVTATAPAPPLPPAKFHVLSDDERAKLAQMKQRVGSSHLGLALAYAHAGLIDKADAELVALQQENAGSPVPSQLRAALRNSLAQ